MNLLKSTLLAAGTLASFGSVAIAADPILPVPVLPPVVAPAPVYDWTGFYIGVGVGGLIQSYDYVDPAGANPDLDFDATDFNGHLVLGANLQMSSMVLGLELTGGGYMMKGNGTGDLAALLPGGAPNPGPVPFDLSSSGYTAGLEARLGYLVTPEILVYGAGGVSAFYSDNATTATYEDPANPGSYIDQDISVFGNLLANFGGGVEFALTENLSVDLGYRYGFSFVESLGVPELEGFSSRSHTITGQILFHF